MDSSIEASSAVIGKSEYSSPQPEITLSKRHTSGEVRKLRAAGLRLAAEVEERSEGHRWCVRVGEASYAGRGITTLKVWLELATDQNTEAAAGVQVLQLALNSSLATSARIPLKMASVPSSSVALQLSGRKAR